MTEIEHVIELAIADEIACQSQLQLSRVEGDDLPDELAEKVYWKVRQAVRMSRRKEEQPIVIHNYVPEIKMPSMDLSRESPVIHNHIPKQDAPKIENVVNVPETKIENVVNVPKQDAPKIENVVNVPETKIENVVNVPETKIENVVNVPKQDAPKIENVVNVPEPKDTATEIEYDSRDRVKKMIKRVVD